MMKLNPRWWWGADTRIGEVFSATNLSYWGFALLVQYRGGLPDSIIYRPLKEIAPAILWPLLLLAVGVFQSLGLCGDIKKIRLPAAVLSGLVYSLFAGIVLTASPLSPGVGVLGLCALLNVYTVVRGPTLGQEKRQRPKRR